MATNDDVIKEIGGLREDVNGIADSQEGLKRTVDEKVLPKIEEHEKILRGDADKDREDWGVVGDVKAIKSWMESQKTWQAWMLALVGGVLVTSIISLIIKAG